jgi:hypothetical protein
MNALRQWAPYLAIELILPGGSLIALALWLYRRYYLPRCSSKNRPISPYASRDSGISTL